LGRGERRRKADLARPYGTARRGVQPRRPAHCLGWRDETVRVWDATSGEEVRPLQGPGLVSSVSFGATAPRRRRSERVVKVWPQPPEGGPYPESTHRLPDTRHGLQPRRPRLVRPALLAPTATIWDVAGEKEILILKDTRAWSLAWFQPRWPAAWPRPARTHGQGLGRCDRSGTSDADRP
jgi:WD40 repeat protein